MTRKKMTLEEGMMLLFEVWEKKDPSYGESPFFGKISDAFIRDFQESMGKREVKTLAKETINWYTEEEDE
jgi:hypothetical protein